MDNEFRPRRTPLPGVGVRYDVVTDDGRHVSVVAHLDGRRWLAFHDPSDDDACRETVLLGPHEADALAKILAPEPLRQYLPAGIDLVTEKIPVTARSPFCGRLLGETQARTRTGASIVAVLRRTSATPSPAPDFRFAVGDVLVVVGTREGVEAVADLIDGG
ncbi:cation:proton antiporter regulatory subunit [Streptomyces sp. NPDC021020]|uniref:cation:proton antiporter regulatory subunit n=1 Tax=Streptomyces sp. NPDC021020 TaxID=3365109 RepID=UPI003789AD33